MGATSNNIKGVILDVMGKYGGLTNSNIASKWICLGCDSDLIFQGIWSRVINQIKEQIAPFLIGVHYVTHQTNLAILVLSKLSLVMHIESMLQSLYAFFSHNPKKVLKFVNLAKTLKIKYKTKYKNSLDINVEPFETYVRKVQITCCEYAHRCTKEQAYLGEFGSIM